jgi:ATP-dependent helicase/nuclease subunit B
VTALLRSSYFQPDWPETRADAEVAQHAEVLLRLLGEPRNRDAYREAVRRWAEDPPPGLEDEQAEESRRSRTHELAQRCRAFFERFFCAWDGAPQQAVPAEHVAWLRRFTADIGIERSLLFPPLPRVGEGLGVRGEERAWQRFQEEIDQWLRLDGRLHAPPRPLARKEFLRCLGSLAVQGGVARTPRGPGRVRILSVPLARTLTVDFLFVLGLGERSFPRLIPPDPLFDEAERQAFRQAGIDMPCVSDQMAEEMLLFYEIATRARRRLVLGYPAVDAKGQPLLPSSFLNHVRDCFTPDAIPVERRTMLIERYDSDEPLSPAEYRVQVARSLAGDATFARSALPPDLHANLRAAAAMARQRLHGDFTVYDGRFRDAGVIAEVAELFGPEKVFSPTALEDYIACPFRFFLRHVLHLETLEEPTEEIEVTRRGQAFHRALSRLHLQLKADGIMQPTAAVDEAVARQLEAAVEEYVARAPSQASKMLWRLEGARLMRVGARYPGHWQKFLDAWKPVAVRPQPFWFEVDFGLSRPGETGFPALVVRSDGIEVRISGRIDRVDVVELEQGVGFWIIDYKTGKSGYYTGKDLSEFRRLQLTLYALAVEQVLLADQQARPLGLAYWMVTENGPKVALPGKGPLTWFHETQRWQAVREQLQGWVTKLAAHIRQGVFALKPRSEHCTQTCDFSQVCRINQARHVAKEWELPLPDRTLSEPEA